jgi:hypothetical protein
MKMKDFEIKEEEKTTLINAEDVTRIVWGPTYIAIEMRDGTSLLTHKHDTQFDTNKNAIDFALGDPTSRRSAWD